MAENERVLFVVSRTKADDLGRARVDEIVAAMAPADVRVETTDSAADLSALLHSRAAAFDRIAIGGGDGTLNAAADKLAELGCTLAIVPLGTANDLARTLGIPSDPVKAAALVTGGIAEPIDLGEVNGHPFFNVAIIGLGAEVAARLSGGVKWLGVASYALALADIWRARRTFRVWITCDDAKASLRAIQVCVGNGRFHGAGLAVSDEARIDDGLLDIYALEAEPLWRLLIMLPALRRGKQRYWKSVTALRGEAATLTTRRRRLINADGEIVTRTPARFRVRRGAVRVLLPPP